MIQGRSGTPFEHHVKAVLEAHGYNLHVVGGSGDGGVDLRGTGPQGQSVIVQCKDWPLGTIAPATVRELYGALHHEQAQNALLVTSGGFSKNATGWAASKPQLQLIDGNSLAHLQSGQRSGSSGYSLTNLRSRRPSTAGGGRSMVVTILVGLVALTLVVSARLFSLARDRRTRTWAATGLLSLLVLGLGPLAWLGALAWHRGGRTWSGLRSETRLQLERSWSYSRWAALAGMLLLLGAQAAWLAWTLS